MWTSTTEALPDYGGEKYRLYGNATALSFIEVLRSWRVDAEFREFFMKILTESPYPTFRWETPPVKTGTGDQIFEFVILDDPSLARNPDRYAFAEYFTSSKSDAVVEFPNLGNDAVLIVPCPRSPSSAYAHLGEFCRRAPRDQQHQLWKCVGAAMENRMGEQPIWLNTAGDGVAWLHVRLDDRPKYYAYRPYR